MLVSKTFLHVQSPRGRELDSKLGRYSKLGGRRSQSQRIGKQQAPDGTPYAPRKQQLRDKAGRVKRKKMFAKLRQAKYFKVSASPNQVSVGFVGRVSRIARVHQDGLTEQVRPGGPRASYEKRMLLGFTKEDRHITENIILGNFRDG
nr:phage virion morphogenesis protein [Xanthomonas hortorum]